MQNLNPVLVVSVGITVVVLVIVILDYIQDKD